MREGRVERRTHESSVTVRVVIEGDGVLKGTSGIKFFDHLLGLIAFHGSFYIELSSTWDLRHHGVEDLSICLGRAFGQALGERRGIRRFGFSLVPMDEALADVAVDLVTRPFAWVDLKVDSQVIEDMAAEDIVHFYESFAMNVPCTLHMNVRYGRNEHHKVEAATKAFALALRDASTVVPNRTAPPSSKGTV
ncbi:MAG: imidazoleglycerol-phosphate dehydratase [Aigarchaeota archaeon]|nr:imidazoleglycerol-phosphate dehydratase [Aigarchaeota archaeon]MDW8092185.1 imidazoleglycerol-phosphate dehydratase [Nitrososphaerota archaeon]